MTDYVIMPKADYQGACDAIRAKTGKTDLIKSGDMATEIEEIKTGGGGSSVSPKDVNFYDYDGTLLHSYTVAEAQALTELPPLPEREGLICQEWNWTLEDIKTVNCAIDVGATYITDDGKTRLYITIPDEERLTVPLYYYQSVTSGVLIDWGDGSATTSNIGNGYKIATHTYASVGDYVITLEVANGSCNLTYNTCGIFGSKYNGSNDLYATMLKKAEIGRNISIGTYAFCHCTSLSTISIPNSVKKIRTYVFEGCVSLKYITIPRSITQTSSEDSTNAFAKCSTLSVVSAPISLLTASGIQNSMFGSCSSLLRISIVEKYISQTQFASCTSLRKVTFVGDNTINIGNASFNACTSLTHLSLPSGLSYINTSAFAGNGAMKVYDFTRRTAVPTLAHKNAFTDIPADCEIRVPASLYDEWIAKTNWSTYADYIVPV